jgi:hypothetical protein
MNANKVTIPQRDLSLTSWFQQLTRSIAVKFPTMGVNGQSFQPNAPASAEPLESLRAALTRTLPEGYFAFLKHSNSGEGFVGDKYIQLWRVEESVEINNGYRTKF